MRTSLSTLNAAVCIAAAMLTMALPVSAQAPGPGTVPDDMRTLVVATRFVAPADGSGTVSPRVQFTNQRVPLSAFNDTDHCIDARALETAQEYFNSLGLVLGKAGFYYELPGADIEQFVATCAKLHGHAPQALTAGKTKVIAFGQVVPTAAAPELEQALR